MHSFSLSRAMLVAIALLVSSTLGCNDTFAPTEQTRGSLPERKYELPHSIPGEVLKAVQGNVPAGLRKLPHLVAISKIMGREEYEVIYWPSMTSALDSRIEIAFDPVTKQVTETWTSKVQDAEIEELTATKSFNVPPALDLPPIDDEGGGGGGGGNPPPQPPSNVVVARLYVDSQYRGSYLNLTANLSGFPSNTLFQVAYPNLADNGFNDVTSSYLFAPIGNLLNDGKTFWTSSGVHVWANTQSVQASLL
jgi:hypothetical protein